MNSDDYLIDHSGIKLNASMKNMTIQSLTENPCHLATFHSRKNCNFALPFRPGKLSIKHDLGEEKNKLIDSVYDNSFAAKIIILNLSYIQPETFFSFSLSPDVNLLLSKITDRSGLWYGNYQGRENFKLHKIKLSTILFNVVLLIMLVRTVLYIVLNEKNVHDIFSSVYSRTEVSRTSADNSTRLKSVSESNILLESVKIFFLSQPINLMENNLFLRDEHCDKFIFMKDSFANGTHIYVYTLYLSRLVSFRPICTQENKVSFITLSDAGFRYTGHDDIVVCDSCQKENRLNEVSKCPLNAKFHVQGCTYIPIEDITGNGNRESISDTPVIHGESSQSSANVSKNRTHRNSIENQETVATGIINQASTSLSVAPPAYDTYHLFEKRLESLQNWSISHIIAPNVIADAGFFYAGYADCVRCFQCGLGFKSWKMGDDINIEHARYRPTCSFLQMKLHSKASVENCEVNNRSRSIIATISASREENQRGGNNNDPASKSSNHDSQSPQFSNDETNALVSSEVQAQHEYAGSAASNVSIITESNYKAMPPLYTNERWYQVQLANLPSSDETNTANSGNSMALKPNLANDGTFVSNRPVSSDMVVNNDEIALVENIPVDESASETNEPVSTDMIVNNDEISLVENIPVDEPASETNEPADFSRKANRRKSFNQWTSHHPLDPDDLSENYFFKGPDYSVTCWRCRCTVHIPVSGQDLALLAVELSEGRPLPCCCSHKLKSLQSHIVVDVEQNGQIYHR